VLRSDDELLGIIKGKSYMRNKLNQVIDEIELINGVIGIT
jgi:hypothetical protein